MSSKNTIVFVALFALLAATAFVLMSRQPTAPVSESNDTRDPAPQAKLDMNVVCEGALAYMSFTDGAAAEAFVRECKEGKHPEVLEQYKLQMGISTDEAI